MLQIRHLTITHLKDFKNMVSDLSLTVNTGDKIAIIGEEGNGKSTLLKLLMNDALVSDYVSYKRLKKLIATTPIYRKVYLKMKVNSPLTTIFLEIWK